jgi:hypothetical protein
MNARMGTIERRGHATMECPECGAVMGTDGNHAAETPIPNGLRWTGVRCECGRSYTVELTEKPREPEP